MRNFIVFLGLLLFAALAGPAGATTRYVSQSGGTFSSGTACSGQNAISVSAFNSSRSSPGDVNYLCGTITTRSLRKATARTAA